MRKGFFASVAALAAGTGVALGQGWPGQPASGSPVASASSTFPMWPGRPSDAGHAGSAAIVPVGGPAGMPPGAAPANYFGGDVPPATEMPYTGLVNGPGGHDQGPPPGFEPGLPPTAGFGSPQVHRAAGGPDSWYIDIEHLVWWPKSQPVAFPLLTMGPPAGAGILGTDGTHVLFGDSNINYNYFNVLRLTGGFWDPHRCWGFEASGFIQEAKGEYFDIVQPQNQIVVVGGAQTIARPAVDVFTGQPTSLLVAVPGQFGGEAHIQARLKMGGGEANVLRSLLYCDQIKLNFLAGVRYIDHDENLQVITRSVIPGATELDTVVSDVFDEFATRNQFFGGQVGFQSEFRRGRFFMDVTGKVGVGDMNEQLVVNGFTNTVGPAGASTLPGGLLALVTNITQTTQNKLSYVPELTLTLGYQVTQRISAYVGYNGLYLSHVLRPGDQIDPVINPVYLPSSTLFPGAFGPARPANTFKETDFWTQGVTFGLSIRY